MTAHAMKGDRERLLSGGMDDYLAKPIHSAELMRILDHFTPADSSADSAPSPFAESEPLDIQAALACMSGDAAILADVATLFLEDCPKMLEEIQAAVAAGCAVDLHRAAHTLKGSLGYLGARAAEALAGQLETLGRSPAIARQVPRILE